LSFDIASYKRAALKKKAASARDVATSQTLKDQHALEQ